ncbi:MAG: hypothetical protein HC795_18795, partial [Coleofasciculaceae cyanobacterium RL_1_1]|nr:hypothetical protein [Coleofasciculaceae cyanobacterium RL_1_1]
MNEVPDEATATSVSLGDFVDVNFLRQTFEADLLTEYRVQNVYNVGKAETVGFIEGRGRTFGGLNLSAAIDFEFYRSTYAAQINANTTTIDTDQSGAIDDLELFDYVTGDGLEQGLNPSKLVDFATSPKRLTTPLVQALTRSARRSRPKERTSIRGKCMTIWQPGHRLAGGKYTIERLLGEGGFCVTYQARDTTDRPVAIQTLNTERSQARELNLWQQHLANTALRLAQCRHRHIVEVEEFVLDG